MIHDLDIFIHFFHPNLKSVTTVINEQEMTPNPAEWVSDVLFIFTYRERWSFSEQGACWLEGWWRHCAVSLCDYHWLWGEESILVWGGDRGQVPLFKRFAPVRPPNATRVYTGYPRQHIILGLTVTASPWQSLPAGPTPCRPRLT